MAKRLRKNREPGKIFVPDPLDLNRWCIDMAMRWPVHEDRLGAYGAAGGVYTQHGGQIQRTEADVIARAKKIRDWVTT